MDQKPCSDTLSLASDEAVSHSLYSADFDASFFDESLMSLLTDDDLLAIPADAVTYDQIIADDVKIDISELQQAGDGLLPTFPLLSPNHQQKSSLPAPSADLSSAPPRSSPERAQKHPSDDDDEDGPSSKKRKQQKNESKTACRNLGRKHVTSSTTFRGAIEGLFADPGLGGNSITEAMRLLRLPKDGYTHKKQFILTPREWDLLPRIESFLRARLNKYGVLGTPIPRLNSALLIDIFPEFPDIRDLLYAGPDDGLSAVSAGAPL
jgi:hypothetical protein